MSSNKQNEATWIMPVSQHAADNVWVMIARINVQGGDSIQSIRVFSTEPTEANVRYQQKLLHENPDYVECSLFEVAVDYFDQEEIDEVGC